MTEVQLTDEVLALDCKVPDISPLHRLCAEMLNGFAAGDLSVHTPAYVCNMVDSRLIPLTECLINAYADGILSPPALW